MTTMEVGARLVDLCHAGKWRDAVEELYADDAVHVEALAHPGAESRELPGKAAILAMDEEWSKSMTVHGQSCAGPYPHDDRFIVFMTIDVTHTAGPMAGNRSEMREACLYTVSGGKIIRAEFFYPDA